MTDPKCGFEMESIVLPLSKILPVRILKNPHKEVSRYKAIKNSIKEIGLVEPLIVSRKAKEYHLVDGHLRHYALKELGFTEAECLISTDDESYTYNARINRLSAIQEHKMIMKAVNDNVPSKRIAAALNLSVERIQTRMRLLDGIDEKVADLLKAKQIAPSTIQLLKKVTPVRQIEIAELLVSTNIYSRSYVEALLFGTSKDQLRNPQHAKAPTGMSADEVARLESEMETLHGDFKAVEASYGESMLNLTIIRGYIKKLIDNVKVARFLKSRHADLFAEFEVVATTELL